MGTQPKHQIPLVLVVDDDELIRMIAQEKLRQAGFEVVVTENGEAALDILSTRAVDIILLDVGLPGRDGFAICSDIRDCPAYESTPILMITGEDDASAIDYSYAAGATDFVTKPVNWPLLPYKLRYMLRGAVTLSMLTQTAEELTRAQRIARLGTWEWQPGISTILWSDEAYSMLGEAADDLEPSLAAFLTYIPPSEQTQFKRWCLGLWRGTCQLDKIQRLQRRDGQERIALIRAERRIDEAGRMCLSGTFQDITERQQAAERIHQLAYYDLLTELSNRTLFREQVGNAIARARRRGEVLAVLYLDLDEFKQVNDTLGHTVGDQLLKIVANRLVGVLRASDVIGRLGRDDETDSTAARLGGDEFAVLLNGLDRGDLAATVAQRICDTMTEGFELGDHEVFVTTSIGIALYPRDGDNVETLLKHADTAMYVAKRSGKNAYRFFDDTMNANAEKRLEINRELRRALDRDEFFLAYQPQMNVLNGAVEGAEALLRWKSETFGMVPPDQFIPVAEDTGLIIPIGEWVLRTACRQARAWLNAGIGLSRIAVNISALQFGQREFVEFVTCALAESGLPANMLELEITESLLAKDADRAIRILGALKELGIQLSIDDFGTGYSSLSYLKQFPVDRLKIDRSFVMNIDTDPDDAAIASAILGMAASMNLKVVAEGVETEAQLDVLRDKQCDEMQGYLLSRPLAAEDMTRWLKQQRVESDLTLTASTAYGK